MSDEENNYAPNLRLAACCPSCKNWDIAANLVNWHCLKYGDAAALRKVCDDWEEEE